MKKMMVCLLFAYCFVFETFAAVGDLDPEFGEGRGWVAQKPAGSYRNYEDIPVATLQRSDGKLVTVGWDLWWGITEVSRHNADGSLDISFNGNGLLTIPFKSNATFRMPTAAVLQPDNKLVIAGNNFDSNGYQPLVLLRLNEDGTYDASFGNKGVSESSPCQQTESLLVQVDGKLVTVCWLQGESASRYLVRFNNNGSLDSSFVSYPMDWISSVIQQADGKLVVVGEQSSSFNSVARFNLNGSLDTTFNGTGIYVSSDAGGQYSKVIQQSDGRLVVLAPGVLLRLNTDGTLDTSFSEDGKQFFDIASTDYDAWSVVEDASHNLVITATDGFEVKLLRFLSNGDLDVSFGIDGITSTSIHEVMWTLPPLLLQADGKWVVASTVTNDDNNTYDIDVHRFTTNGAVDTSFANAGIARINFGGYVTTNAATRTGLQQADGKLVTAGTLYDVKSTLQFGLVRYNIDGSLDTTFNGVGSVITTMVDNSHRSSMWSEVYSLIQQHDGKLLAAGFTQEGKIAIVRYNLDGSYDTSFNGSGKLTDDLGTASNKSIFSVVQQSDDKIVVAGSAYNFDTGFAEYLLVRYNLDGTLDTTFNGIGYVTYVTLPYGGYFQSVLQQNDGRLVATGTDGGGFDVARFNLDGTFDTTFGGNGEVTTVFNIWGHGADIAIQQSDGKLIVGGHSGAFGILMARYNSDGSLDTTFGDQGKVTGPGLPVYGPPQVERIYLRENGKIMVVASGYVGQDEKSQFIVSYNSDGSLNTNFGVDGVLNVNLSSILQVSSVNAAFLQVDGKLVAAGTSTGVVSQASSSITMGVQGFSVTGTNALEAASVQSNSTTTTATGEGMFVARFITTSKDSDKDGISDAHDNCPLNANAAQTDSDGDGKGNVCDKMPHNPYSCSKRGLKYASQHKQLNLYRRVCAK